MGIGEHEIDDGIGVAALRFPCTYSMMQDRFPSPCVEALKHSVMRRHGIRELNVGNSKICGVAMSGSRQVHR